VEKIPDSLTKPIKVTKQINFGTKNLIGATFHDTSHYVDIAEITFHTSRCG